MSEKTQSIVLAIVAAGCAFGLLVATTTHSRKPTDTSGGLWKANPSSPVLRDDDGEAVHVWITVMRTGSAEHEGKHQAWSLVQDPWRVQGVVWGYIGEPGDAFYLPLDRLEKYSLEHYFFRHPSTPETREAE